LGFGTLLALIPLTMASDAYMKIKTVVFVFVLVLMPIFVSATDIKDPYPLFFNAANPERGKIPVARYLPSTSNSNGTVIFIYGGSASGAPFGDELEHDALGRIFTANGYTLVIPDYRRYISRRSFDAVRFAYGTEAQKRADFEADVDAQVADLNKFIEEYNNQFPDENLVVMGHSYGGYLVNLLATERLPGSPVKGYISSHGIWGPVTAQNESWHAKFYHTISGQPKDLVPMLVFLSKKDTQVGDQSGYFSDWLQGGNHEHVKAVVFEGHGHFLDPKSHPDFRSFRKELLKFLKSLTH